jgi:hypothetical protein
MNAAKASTIAMTEKEKESMSSGCIVTKTLPTVLGQRNPSTHTGIALAWALAAAAKPPHQSRQFCRIKPHPSRAATETPIGLPGEVG